MPRDLIMLTFLYVYVCEFGARLPGWSKIGVWLSHFRGFHYVTVLCVPCSVPSEDFLLFS
jgi:hypothetical protein